MATPSLMADLSFDFLAVCVKRGRMGGLNPAFMKTKTFLAGAVFGALVAFCFGAADDQTTSWEYSVQMHDLGYGTCNDSYYTKALNRMATNGWEVLCSRRVDYRNVEIVLKRPKS